MSLKAKIEAVIYASEEPVTLAQLTGLLGEEGRAELDAQDARQQQLALEAADTTGDEDNEDALNAETLTPPGEPLPAEVATEKTQVETEETQVDTKNLGAPFIAQPLARWVGRDNAAIPDAAGPELEKPAEAGPEADRSLDETQTATTAATAAKARDRRLRDFFRSLLDELIADYANADRGLEIREVAGGFRLATRPEYHDAVRGFVKSLKPPLKLSLQALETLAVVAYKQPVTAPEISEIRGVDTSGVLGSLLARKLITTAGRKQVIGRPILYKTTREFLLRFGLKDVNELPSIEEFEKLAGELNDAVQEEIPMETTPQDSSDDAASEDNGLRAGGEPAQPIADEVLIDGRLSGPPPTYAANDPSALEAEIQSEESTGAA